MKAGSTQILQSLTVFILFLWTAQVQAQPAAAVPDPSSALVLLPAAAKAGPPAWVHPGTRLVYFAASASIPGTGKQLVLDDKGNWVNKDTGQRWGEQDVASASGAGYSVFQVGYIDHDVAQLGCSLYLLDVTDGSVQFTTSSGMVTNAGSAADLWVNPDVLKNVKDIPQGDVRIIRIPYTVNKKKYNAIRFQTTTANGYTAYVYDLETGIMIFHGSSAQGAGVLTAPVGGGAAGIGAGSTQLVTGWLVEVKDVEVPWKAAAVPAWVGKFTKLDYQGVQSTAVAGAGQVDQRVAVATTPKARHDGWLRSTNNFTVQSLVGMPPDQSQSEGSGGPATIGGQWIGPDAIPQLKARQLIDRNDITKTVISVSDVNPRSVTVSEVGQRHRIDWTYDAATGILAAVRTTTTLGLGQITYRVQLVGQR